MKHRMFSDLAVGEAFDFLGSLLAGNSFRRRVKISATEWRDLKGTTPHRVYLTRHLKVYAFIPNDLGHHSV